MRRKCRGHRLSGHVLGLDERFEARLVAVDGNPRVRDRVRGVEVGERDEDLADGRPSSLLGLGLSLDAIGPILPRMNGGVPDACPELVDTFEGELARLDAVVVAATEARRSIEGVLHKARAA